MGRYAGAGCLISLAGVQKGFPVRQLNNSASVSLDGSTATGQHSDGAQGATL